MQKSCRTAFFFILVVFVFQGCYSFNGGSQVANFKTIAIPVFGDRSGAGIAQFRAELSKGIVDRIESQSFLRFTPSMARADALLEGTITSFSDLPGQLSVTTGRAIMNRITLIVQVTMEERVTKKNLFSQTFVAFADYPAGNYVAQQEAIHFAIGQIVDGIFDRVVSGW